MRTTKISTFDQSHLAKAVNVAANHPKTYTLKSFGDHCPKVAEIYRIVGEHCRHNKYNTRTGECISSFHVFPHGSVRYIDKEIWVTDLTSGQRYELNVESKADFCKRMREILPNIM